MKRISGVKPFTIYLVVAVIGAIILSLGYWHYQKTHSAKSNTIYSLSGEVMSVSGDKVVFGAVTLVKTDQGNVIDHQNKTALIDVQTKIEKSGSEKPVTIKDIKVGTRINAFFARNPATVDELVATRIVIQ